MGFSFQIITYGCKVNQYESQSVREYWQSLGGEEIAAKDASSDSINPDIVLLAGCAVTAQGIADARQMVRKCLREMPQTKVIVTGCAASAEPQDFVFENVIACISQTAKWNLLHHHPLNLPKSFEEKNTEYPDFRITDFARSRPVLKIQDGCSHFCTYCIVPYTRGKARSRSQKESLAELRRLLEAGFREIMISGINLRQYYADGQNFWGFLRSAEKEFGSEWKGRVRLRLSSLEPAQLNDEGLETLAQSSLLCPHLHLSLQSGSPSVLQRMGREHYTPDFMIGQINKIKDFWPVFALGADILMGFAGETDREVDETLAMVDALPFTYAHVFPYSVRKGTKAEMLPNQLEKHVKQEHALKVRRKIEEKKKAFLQAMLARQEMEVSLDVGTNEGWNEFYVACELENAPKTHELIKVKPLAAENGKIKAAAV